MESFLVRAVPSTVGIILRVHAQDEYCIIYHTKGCLDQGCSKQEILETVAVTAAFGGGASMSQGGYSCSRMY